jgi:hypothetical protein
MRRFATLAVVVLGGLATVTAAQAANTTITNTSFSVSFSEFVPCANGGAGETVDFTGTVHSLLRTTINGNRFSQTFEGNYQGVTGTGETTGDTYVGNGAEHQTFNGSLTNGQFTGTFTTHVNFIGKGSAPNLTFSEVAHITVNANGDVTVNFDNFSVDCG